MMEPICCSGDLLIVDALEIAAKNAVPPVGLSFDRWKRPLQLSILRSLDGCFQLWKLN